VKGDPQDPFLFIKYFVNNLLYNFTLHTFVAKSIKIMEVLFKIDNEYLAKQKFANFIEVFFDWEYNILPIECDEIELSIVLGEKMPKTIKNYMKETGDLWKVDWIRWTKIGDKIIPLIFVSISGRD
jgi:hypothetical protein